jgi:hypothetical protein
LKEGVKLLEFRHSTAFDTKFHEKDPARFRAKAEDSLTEASAYPINEFTMVPILLAGNASVSGPAASTR